MTKTQNRATLNIKHLDAIGIAYIETLLGLHKAGDTCMCVRVDVKDGTSVAITDDLRYAEDVNTFTFLQIRKEVKE